MEAIKAHVDVLVSQPHNDVETEGEAVEVLADVAVETAV